MTQAGKQQPEEQQSEEQQSAAHHRSDSHNEKPIRKQVGRPRDEEKSPAQQLWDLRQRMMDLGIDFGNDNERIRKVVGGPRDE